MDLERLKQAGQETNFKTNKEVIKSIIAKFPNEKDAFTDAMQSFNVVNCKKEMYREDKLHPYNKQYHFGFLFTSTFLGKPQGIYLDTLEAYYYILDEENKTLTQVPKYNTATACYFPVDNLYDCVGARDEANFLPLSDTITFKSTSIALTDMEITEFKKFVQAERNMDSTVNGCSYNEYDVIKKALDIFKPFIDNVPEKVIATDRRFAGERGRASKFIDGYTVYIEGSSDGMQLLAKRELEEKQLEIFGNLNTKQITQEITKALQTEDLSEPLENLFYDFFSASPQAKTEKEFLLTIGAYFNKDDDGTERVIHYDWSDSALVVNTDPVNVVAVLSSADEYVSHFNSFFNWEFLKINIPEVVIPMSKNVMKYRYDLCVYFSDSGTVLDYKLDDVIYDTLKPRLIENNIKINTAKWYSEVISDKLNCVYIGFVIKNPLLQGDD